MDFIEVYPNVLDSGTCRSLIEIFEKNNSVETSPIISAAGSGMEHHVRRSKGLILTPDIAGTHYEAVNKAYLSAYNEYRKKYPILERVSQIVTEVFTVVRYKDSDEHYAWHVDGADAGSRYRFISGVCYLNSMGMGGETEFKIQNKKVKPQEGAILLFPSGWTHEHQGLPPQSGSKYIITTWLRFADHPAL